MFSFKTDKPKQPKQLSFKPGEYVDIWNYIYHYDGQVVSRPYICSLFEKKN